jgi:hypothetical protein|eukprot:COSAG01_NODE_685_length_14250_cov_18.752032_9_plen_68_part_00
MRSSAEKNCFKCGGKCGWCACPHAMHRRVLPSIGSQWVQTPRHGDPITTSLSRAHAPSMVGKPAVSQ